MDYDVWKTGYYDCQPEKYCSDCEYFSKKISDAREHLEAIVKQLYIKESLDLDLLEHNIDELCHLLRVKIGFGPLQISRPKVDAITRIADWMESENKFLQSIN